MQFFFLVIATACTHDSLMSLMTQSRYLPDSSTWEQQKPGLRPALALLAINGDLLEEGKLRCIADAKTHHAFETRIEKIGKS